MDGREERKRARDGERLGNEGQMNELSFSWLMPGDKHKASGVDWTGNLLPTQLPTSHHSKERLTQPVG